MDDRRRRQRDLFDRLAVVGKAFASANRLRIIDVLARGERSVEALAHEVELAVTTTSAHLQILKAANVVSTRAAGTRVFYRLAGDDVAALYASLGAVGRAHSADVERALASYFGTDSLDEVDVVSRGELRRRMRAGEVSLIDVRPAEEFEAGHIPGARSLPFDDLLQRLDELDPGADLVAYCRGPHCVMAHDAVRLLGSHGRTARRLDGGMLEWRAEGLPVAAGAA